jgi:hypothetical protein
LTSDAEGFVGAFVAAVVMAEMVVVVLVAVVEVDVVA